MESQVRLSARGWRIERERVRDVIDGNVRFTNFQNTIGLLKTHC